MRRKRTRTIEKKTRNEKRKRNEIVWGDEKVAERSQPPPRSSLTAIREKSDKNPTENQNICVKRTVHPLRETHTH